MLLELDDRMIYRLDHTPCPGQNVMLPLRVSPWSFVMAVRLKEVDDALPDRQNSVTVCPFVRHVAYTGDLKDSETDGQNDMLTRELLTRIQRLCSNT